MWRLRLQFLSRALLIVIIFSGRGNAANRRGSQKTSRNASRQDSCNKPKAYLCDCEEVPRDAYFNIRQNFDGQLLDCSPLCDGKASGNCVPECDQVICSVPLVENQEICSTKLYRNVSESIRNSRCKYNQRLQMHVCKKDGHRMEIDDQTFRAVTEGYCVPGCNVALRKLKCEFKRRYIGDPIAEEIVPPIEPPTEPPEMPPIEPPEVAPIEPPAPEPEIEEIDEEPPVEPPEVSEVVIMIDIPVGESDVSMMDRSSLHYGSWSDCTQFCAETDQTGPRVRRRSASCRNSFGMPVPMSECETVQQPDVVDECSAANCIGDFYYLLGNWSACTQECATYNQATGSMSVGSRERDLTCLHLNGTEAEREQCLDLIEFPELELASICGTDPCQPVHYALAPWGECSCRTESRIREVACVDLEGNLVEEQLCEALGIRKPRALEFCAC